jgi:SAM-dependent methyltransferase
MADRQIRFEDGAAYEKMMGQWSQLAGRIFLDWLAPPRGLRWLDVGCGNGAFSELVIERAKPLTLSGIDPSEAQLDYARKRHAAGIADYRLGDAMALPYADNSFDAASMALVIFFVPDPAKGLAEMARVVTPGGHVAAYGWDLLGGGFPNDSILSEMRGMGVEPLMPPSPGAAGAQSLHKLWQDTGLEDVETREIAVERTFASFEEFWDISTMGSSLRQTLASWEPEKTETLKSGVRRRIAGDRGGPVTLKARANAAKGRVRR